MSGIGAATAWRNPAGLINSSGRAKIVARKPLIEVFIRLARWWLADVRLIIAGLPFYVV